MAFGTASIDRQTLINNVVGLAKAAKVFNVPAVLTTVASKTFSGEIFPQIQAVFPESQPIDRTTMNAWEDVDFRRAIEATERRKIIMAGLWTEVCVAFPAIEAVRDGFDVYAVVDGSGGTSEDAHKMAVERMIQAGVVPMTWLQVLLEFQRDWARMETYNAVGEIVMEHAGAYGIGSVYAKSVYGSHASEASGAKN
jgi:nicotinamidase-related amidase